MTPNAGCRHQTDSDVKISEPIVYLRDSFSILQSPPAVELLAKHGLTPKKDLSPADDPRVVAVVVGLGQFSLADAARFSNLKTVARFGAGADNIAAQDLWRARRIVSSCTSDLATRDVAEFALGLIILATRGAARDLKGLGATPSKWRVIDRTKALCDSVVAVIGAGNIGLETARLVAPLVSRVLLWNRSSRPLELGDVEPAKIERVTDIGEIARRADTVSLHVALGDETRGLIGEAFFNEVRRARRSVALVNTARGEVVDEAQLLAALDDRTVRDAAIDVWSTEGVRESDVVKALRAHPSVMATSHIGSHTDGVLHRYATQCVRNVAALVEDRAVDVAKFVVKVQD